MLLEIFVEAAAQGTKFNPFPQKLILYFRGRASRLIRCVLYAFFRRQNQFHLRRDQAFMKDNVQPTLRAEIWRHFSLYFAAVIFAISLRYLSAVKAGNSTGFERPRRCAFVGH